MHFLQCLDTSHELEGVMTRVVSTNVTFECAFLNRDIRSMVQQCKVGITRSAVDGALLLEYEDMFTGKRSKLSKSQCLYLGQIEIPKVRLFPSVLAPQIGPIGDFEGEPVMLTSWDRTASFLQRFDVAICFNILPMLHSCPRSQALGNQVVYKQVW